MCVCVVPRETTHVQSAQNKTGRLATMAKAACQSMEAALLGIYSLTGLSLWMCVPSSPKPIDKGVQ